jgi:hypothetical protein
MRFCRILSVLLTAAIAQSSAALAQTGADDLRGALSKLDSWLGSSDHGPTWRAFLKSDALAVELEKGGQADKEVLAGVLKQYQAKESGLNRQQFADVRQAIQAWIAELNLPAADTLGELANTAAPELKPVDPEKLVQAKKQLEDVLKQTDSSLKRGGQEREAGWKEFFKWDRLQEELQAEKPNLDRVTQVWASLASEQPGVDHPKFIQMREALRNQMELQEILGDENNALATLPEKLKAYQENANEGSSAALGNILGWMDRTKQNGDLVKAVRHHFAKPNLFVESSDRLVLFGMDQPVDEKARVSDYQEGTSINGNSHTVGDIKAKLVPNHKRGEINVHMTGKMNASTVGYNNNGVTIRSSGVTSIEADKPVYFVESGMQDAPAVARCRTRNTVHSVSATSGQVESIARQRIAENHSSNEQRAARRAEDQIERQLNDRVRKQVSDANKRFQDDFFAPLARRGVTPRLVKNRSTDTQVLTTMILAAPEHLAAPNEPPAMTTEGDMRARIHVSWFNNLGDILMRGSVMTDEGLAKTVEEWRGEVPEELKITEDSDPWNIVFASRRPLVVAVGDDTISITLRGARFTARRSTMNEPMNILANYKIHRNGGGVKLIREGDVAVEFPEQGDSLSPRYLALKSFWQTKFGGLFPPEMDDLSLKLRGNWEKAGPLKLTGLAARENGWIAAVWVMPPDAEGEPAAQRREFSLVPKK